MRVFVGTKIVAAEAMNDVVFEDRYRKPATRHSAFIATADQRVVCDGYMVQYEDGYISWSPKETFERSYREITGYEAGLLMSSWPGGSAKDAQAVVDRNILDPNALDPRKKFER